MRSQGKHLREIVNFQNGKYGYDPGCKRKNPDTGDWATISGKDSITILRKAIYVDLHIPIKFEDYEAEQKVFECKGISSNYCYQTIQQHRVFHRKLLCCCDICTGDAGRFGTPEECEFDTFCGVWQNTTLTLAAPPLDELNEAKIIKSFQSREGELTKDARFTGTRGDTRWGTDTSRFYQVNTQLAPPPLPTFGDEAMDMDISQQHPGHNLNKPRKNNAERPARKVTKKRKQKRGKGRKRHKSKRKSNMLKGLSALNPAFDGFAKRRDGQT